MRYNSKKGGRGLTHHLVHSMRLSRDLFSLLTLSLVEMSKKGIQGRGCRGWGLRGAEGTQWRGPRA